MVEFNIKRPSDREAEKRTEENLITVTYFLGNVAIARAAMRAGRVPLITEILNEIDAIADLTKEGIRDGIFQDFQNQLATELEQWERRNGQQE